VKFEGKFFPIREDDGDLAGFHALTTFIAPSHQNLVQTTHLNSSKVQVIYCPNLAKLDNKQPVTLMAFSMSIERHKNVKIILRCRSSCALFKSQESLQLDMI